MQRAHRPPRRGRSVLAPPRILVTRQRSLTEIRGFAAYRSARGVWATHIELTTPAGPAMPLTPNWFHPETIPGVQELQFDTGRDMNHCYRVFFTPGSDQVYVLWFTT